MLFFRYNTLMSQEVFKFGNIESLENLKVLKESNNEFYVPISKDTLKILTLPYERNSFVKLGACSDSLPLNFLIKEDYLSRVYCLDFRKIGKIILIESFFPGSTGLSANVVNVSLIILNDNCISEILSFNSFYAGVPLILMKKDKLQINILDFTDLEQGEKPIYCRNIFEVDSDLIIKPVHSRENGCYYLLNYGFMKKLDTCFSCNQLLIPFVMQKKDINIKFKK